MTPAEELAALKALQGALVDAIKAKEAEVLHVRQLTGARSFDTELGSVTWTKRKPTIGFDDDQLLAWAKENMPHEVEVIERVRDTLKKTLQSRFYPEPDGTVWDSQTGEQIVWAHTKEGSEFATVRLSDEAKSRAQEAVHGRLNAITRLVQVEA